ncbi:hypothetical protein CJU92_00725 [Brucella melitensis]|nr:hypothetical protein CJU92_00725 [Brucella melitensis]
MHSSTQFPPLEPPIENLIQNQVDKQKRPEMLPCISGLFNFSAHRSRVIAVYTFGSKTLYELTSGVTAT